MDPNADDHVRPVPIEPEDEEASRGLDVEAAPARPVRAQRPWLPLVIAISAVVIVFISIGIFGALEFEEPERSNPDEHASDVQGEGEEAVTPTTLPPRLDEIIPGTTDRLTIITEDGDGVWAVLWDPSFRIPNQEPIEVPDDALLAGVHASFDRSGQYVALTTCPNGDCVALIGTPTDMGSESQFESQSFVWHASEVGRIAWLAWDDEGTTIFTATVNPATGSLDDVHEALHPDGAQLHRFDSAGFILGINSTSAFDHDGNLLWELEDVHPVSSSDSTVFGVVPGMVDGDAVEFNWVAIDRTTGEVVDERLTGPAENSAYWVSTTEDTDLIVRISGFPDAGGEVGNQGNDETVYQFSMTTTGGDMRVPRIKSFSEPLIPVRFTRNGQFFVFTNEPRTELVFVNWWNGAEHTVPLPDGHRVIDFHLG